MVYISSKFRGQFVPLYSLITRFIPKTDPLRSSLYEEAERHFEEAQQAKNTVYTRIVI